MSIKKIIRLCAEPEGFGKTPDELDAELFASSLPVQCSHDYYEDEQLGLYIGVWDTTDMIEASGPYVCDEFMWILEGEAVIKNADTGVMEKAKAGEAFVIPKGYDCQWHQSGYLRKFYVIYDNPNETLPAQPTYEGIVILPANTPIELPAGTEPFLVTTGNPVQQHICYIGHTGKFISGVWESEAFESEPRAFSYNKFVCVQAGSLTLIEESGEEHHFNMGEALFVPEGVVCSARSTENVRLCFATVRSV